MHRQFKNMEEVKTLLRTEKPLVDLMASCGLDMIRVNGNLYKALCCFHNENTPSMMVTPRPNKDDKTEGGLYHCFGCGAGGDEFSFLEHLYNLSFIESIHRYAEIAQLDLNPYYRDLTPQEQVLERLVGVLDSYVLSAQYALANVDNPQKYLQDRGFTSEILQQFRVGYSQKPIINATAEMKSLELDRTDIFNDSLIFPDFDPYGRPVRIYGRPFSRTKGDAKYIGTSQHTPLFQYTLYGFHIARKNARKYGGRIIAVEGQADVIKMHQHGFDNTTGLKGKTFNNDTINLLKQFKIQEVILLLDGDPSGMEATQRIVSWYLGPDRPDIRLRVASIYGYDPDDFLNQFGTERMKEVINGAIYAIEYAINHVFSSKPYSTLTEKMDLLRELQPYLNNADDVERKLAINEIASRLGMDAIYVDDFFKARGVVNKYQLYSVDGERIILSGAMASMDFLISIADKLTPDDFYLAKHRTLYKILVEMSNNKGMDTSIDTVIAAINNRGMSALFDNGEYVKGLMGLSTANVEWHINDVLDKSMRRRVDVCATDLKLAVVDLNVDSSQAIEIFNSKVTDIVVGKTDDKIHSAAQQIDNTMATIIARTKNPSKMVGPHIGDRLSALSQQLMGLQTKKLMTIGANQGVGKSKLLANIVTHVAIMENVPVLWFSYEMDYEELTMRNLAIMSGISQDAMLTGTMTYDEHDILQQWALKMRQAPLIITEKGRCVEEAVAIARKHVLHDGIKFIAFDYIQLMYSSRRHEKRNQELGVISKVMKEMCQDLNIGILNVAQIGKHGVQKDLVGAEDTYGSYEIAQDSDIYIALQRKPKDQIDAEGLQKGNLLMYLDKNRGRKDDQLYNVYAHDTNCRLQIV